MWKPVQARKGADLPHTFGAHGVAGWRKGYENRIVPVIRPITRPTIAVFVFSVFSFRIVRELRYDVPQGE